MINKTQKQKLRRTLRVRRIFWGFIFTDYMQNKQKQNLKDYQWTYRLFPHNLKQDSLMF